MYVHTYMISDIRMNELKYGLDSLKTFRRLDTKLPQLAEYSVLLLGDA